MTNVHLLHENRRGDRDKILKYTAVTRRMVGNDVTRREYWQWWPRSNIRQRQTLSTWWPRPEKHERSRWGGKISSPSSTSIRGFSFRRNSVFYFSLLSVPQITWRRMIGW